MNLMKKYIKSLRKIWESEKWDSDIIEGIIDNLLPNGQSGFISTNKRYYFLTKEFKGKKEQLNSRSKSQFLLREGFDKKKKYRDESCCKYKAYIEYTLLERIVNE